MVLVPVELQLVDAPLPAEVNALLTDADGRIEEYLRNHRHDARTGFYPSDYVVVWRALCALRRQSPELERFCEWGCGYAVVTGLAAMLGFEAYGIEIEARLVDGARGLLADHDIDAEVLDGSFVPEEYAAHETLSDLDTRTLVSGHGAREADLEIADCDVVFAFPWPSEEDLYCDLFARYAADGAVLVTHHNVEGIHAYRQRRAAGPGRDAPDRQLPEDGFELEEFE